ncbi:YhgE/Pip domain-containing protein [Lysinibacillus sphaericus]|uniref:YhgE/Pip domain-containing protein n=1 Tax=Lysinibacillus sphaericus TaxID=1421 RepID=UPI002162F070|nr:ABC transporter permease [Lysinibacillus sphaericus]MCS1382242.1 ABC transporter permease [Lysinibacillus sphaericus]
MTKGLQALFKIRETYIGIVATIAFQLIFFSIWMTAYDGINDRTDNLTIGYISEDAAFGQEVIDGLKKSLPFASKDFTSIDRAEKDLENRYIHMIIHIPAEFTAQLKAGKEANIIYFINQANASLAKTMMEGVAKQTTNEVNHQLYPVQQGEIVKAFSQQFSQLPMEQNSALLVQDTVTTTIMGVKDRIVESTIIKTNDAKGFAANFVPLMVIISSFVGAMVMIMQHQQAAQMVQDSVSKWSLFFARQLLNFAVAFILPLLTIGLMQLFAISSDESLFTIYFFQAFMFWAFLCLAQVFVILFGNLGMIFNICALSLQLVTSGVLVPNAMLSDFYHRVASLLPATYGADGYYTIIFGGNIESLISNSSALGMIIVVTLAIAIIAVALKKPKVLQLNN